MIKGFDQGFVIQMTNLKNSYLLSFATTDLLGHEDVLTILEKDFFGTGSFHFPFSQITNLVRSSAENFRNLTWEYSMFCSRQLLISLYEAFKDSSDRYNHVKDTNWFIFLANIRHSLSHGIDAEWSINDFGKGEIFYVRESDGIKCSINSAWQGTTMKLEHIGGWPTLIDLINFIEKKVTEYNKSDGK